MDDNNKFHGHKLLIIWIIVFIVIILVAWTMTWQWKFGFDNQTQGEGSLNSTMSSLSDSWQQLRDDFAAKDINISSISETFKQGVEEINQQNKNITAGVLTEITKLKMGDWPRYESESLNFQYPETWTITEDDKDIVVKDEDLEVLVFKIYNDQEALPDNINDLDLYAWLVEQSSRELSIFDELQEVDLEFPYVTYRVATRNNVELSNIWWQDDQIVWLSYNADEEYQELIDLIFSTIK